jgi:hypothetical protein
MTMSNNYDITPKDKPLGPKTKQALRTTRWFIRLAIWLGLRKAGL